MKFLRDDEVIEWNSILINLGSSLSVRPIYGKLDTNMSIGLIYKRNYMDDLPYHTNSIDEEPNISYIYQFSITKDSYPMYLNIENQIYGNFGNKVITNEGKNERKINIEDVLIKKQELSHKIGNVDFILIKITLQGKMCDVFSYYSLYKRYLDLLSLYWTIDEDKPKKLFKYNELDIVYDKNEKEDVIIKSFYFDDKFFSITNKKISYNVMKLIRNNKGFIEYSIPYSVIQDDLKPSRNQIISSIIEE